MARNSRAATEAAARLWARCVDEVTAPEEATATADRLCAVLRAVLTRWIGVEGYRTLLGRALGQVRADHPGLASLSCDGTDGPGDRATVWAHGADEVPAAVVALVAALIDLLGRIVGEEMAVQMVERTWAASPRTASDAETAGGRYG